MRITERQAADIKLYRAAYAALGAHTPLLGDCGALCSAACCHGGRHDGMIVFPGEELLLRRFYGMRLKRAELRGIPCRFALCRSACLRHPEMRARRPLSCRIFPYAPHFAPDGALEVIPDPRARAVCPIAKAPGERADADPEFARSVQSAFEILLRRPGMREFLGRYSDMLDDYKKFF